MRREASQRRTRRGVRVPCPNCKKGQRVVAGPVEEGDESDAPEPDDDPEQDLPIEAHL